MRFGERETFSWVEPRGPFSTGCSSLIISKDTRSSRYKKTTNQMANRTLEQEMETDDDHATMRESFSLVQNIFFIGYTNVLPAH